MGRKILAVIVAMITAVAIIWVAFMISSMSAPFYPKNMEYMSRDELSAYMHSLPMSAFITVLVGYILAAFAGGFIVTKMSRRESPGKTLPLIIGVLLTIGGVANFLIVPGEPMWFILASLLVYIPFSLLGHRFAR